MIISDIFYSQLRGHKSFINLQTKPFKLSKPVPGTQ